MTDYELDSLNQVCVWVLDENRGSILWTRATATAVKNLLVNARQQMMRAECAERVARTLYDLWPVEFWGTLASVADDHPWLENKTINAAEAAGGEA